MYFYSDLGSKQKYYKYEITKFKRVFSVYKDEQSDSLHCGRREVSGWLVAEAVSGAMMMMEEGGGLGLSLSKTHQQTKTHKQL